MTLATRRLRLVFALVALASGLSGAPRPGLADRVVRSLYEIRTERVVIQEWDLSCGAAALATLLRFQHGDPVTEREIAVSMMSKPRYINNPVLVQLRNGFSLLDLKEYVDARGYQGIGFGGLELGDLVARAPIMVPIERAGYNHFVVFRGVSGKRVLLADPSFGTFTMPISRFQRVWLDLPALGRVGFVVAHRDGRIAAPGNLAPRPEEFVTFR